MIEIPKEPRFPKLRAKILKANPFLDPWSENWVERTGFSGPGAKGWARRGRLTICPFACTQAGRGYSWPGSVSDCTVRGVYLHEIGHIVHASFGNEEQILKELRALGGPKVTGYEPNAMETFAETFRLYAGNPALLMEGRPWRYEYMEQIGVKPPAGRPKNWEDGLVGDQVPQRFYDQCERWIARGKERMSKSSLF